MGNEQGSFNFAGAWNLYFHPDVTPFPDSEPTFDPNFGFSEPREERVMIATPEEMESANIEQVNRDYCAHTYIGFLSCREKNTPWIRNCTHEYHTWQNCLYQMTMDTWKDYERERRLLERKKRIEAKKAKLEAKKAQLEAAEALNE